MDAAAVEALAGTVAQKIVGAALRGSVDDRLHEMERKLKTMKGTLDDALSSAGSVRVARAQRGAESFQQHLVTALVLPPEDRQEAERLALRLLRQACEVSALLCAGPDSVRIKSEAALQLRSKCRSLRDVRDVCRQVIADRVQHILAKTGRAAQDAVNTALRGEDPSESPDLTLNLAQSSDMRELRQGPQRRKRSEERPTSPWSEGRSVTLPSYSPSDDEQPLGRVHDQDEFRRKLFLNRHDPADLEDAPRPWPWPVAPAEPVANRQLPAAPQ